MRYLVFFILSLLFWLLLTFSLDVYNILVGVVASLLTVAFFGRFFVKDVRKLFQPLRYFYLIIYLFVFIWECIKANFDVAYRVLHPKMPIKPGIVKVKLDVKSDMARTILANSITMTPGTISVDIVDDYLYVHWIYVSSENPEEYGRIVSGRFEKHIKRIFE